MIVNYLRQNLTLQKLTGVDTYGKSIFAAPIACKCRFEDDTKIVLNSNGESLTAVGAFWVLPRIDVNTGDLITYAGNNYRVIDTYVGYLLNGNTHKKAYVQVWREV